MDSLKETKPITSTAGVHNAKFSEDGDIQMNVFWEHMPEAFDTSESDDYLFASEDEKTANEPQRCFLDTPAPFDLAILAADVSRWNVETGLDADEVKYCLDNASWCLGASLHAKWAPIEQWEPFMETVAKKSSEESGAS